VTGYENPQYNAFVTPAVGDDAWMCHAQITQSSDYASFNFLYIVLVLVVGGFIIAASYIVPWAADRLRKQDKTEPELAPLNQFDPTLWSNTGLPNLVEQACNGKRQSNGGQEVVVVGRRSTR
jgi:hypothetical protein